MMTIRIHQRYDGADVARHCEICRNDYAHERRMTAGQLHIGAFARSGARKHPDPADVSETLPGASGGDASVRNANHLPFDGPRSQHGGTASRAATMLTMR